MSDPFNIPEEYRDSFRRLFPYLAAPLRNSETVLQSILLYLKLGNEKLARIAIDAYNENYRLSELENRRKMREEALLRENMEGEGEEDDDEFEDEEDQKEEDDESS